MQLIRRLAAVSALAALSLSVSAGAALAQAPRPWEMGLQPAHSPVHHAIHSLHDLVTWLMAGVTLFVAGLIAYVLWKYRAGVHPKASRVSHNTPLEIAWTLVPALILVIIAIPSFRLIYLEDRAPNAAMTVKVVGHQWYWEYQYPDHDNIRFDSYMIQDADLKPGQLRNLEVDNQIVIPVGKDIRILTTSADVIHSWFIPALGVQRYAIPGRTIETWVRSDTVGTFYGQCNQICGTNHSAMPVAVRALSEADFNAWVAEAKTKFASDLNRGGAAQHASRSTARDASRPAAQDTPQLAAQRVAVMEQAR